MRSVLASILAPQVARNGRKDWVVPFLPEQIIEHPRQLQCGRRSLADDAVDKRARVGELQLPGDRAPSGDAFRDEFAMRGPWHDHDFRGEDVRQGRRNVGDKELGQGRKLIASMNNRPARGHFGYRRTLSVGR